MAMKRYGITMQGPFILEKQAELPQFSSENQGRIIYNTAEKSLYYSSYESYVTREISKTNIPMYESNGDILWDDMGDGLDTTWVATNDGLNGTTGYNLTTDTIFGKGCKVLDAGNTPGSGTTKWIKATRTTNVDVPSKFTMTIKFLDPLVVSNSKFVLKTTWGVFTFYYNAVGKPLITGWVVPPDFIEFPQWNVVPNKWFTVTFVIDYSVPAFATYDLLLDGIYCFRNAPCNDDIGGSGNSLEVTKYNTVANCKLYIDYIKLGTGLVEINQSSIYGTNQYFKNWDNKSYILGGRVVGTTSSDTITRMLFGNDFIELLSSTLDIAKQDCCGLNSKVSGYVIGGTTGASTAALTTVNKICFSNDTESTLDKTLSGGLCYSSGVSNKLAGYCLGGGTSSVTTAPNTTIYKMLFSSEATLALSTSIALTAGKTQGCGFYDLQNGYTAGGQTGGNNVSTVNKIGFSTEIVSAVSSTLSVTSARQAACFSTSNAYLFGGGITSGNVMKWDFSNDTCSVLSNTQTDRTAGMGSSSNSSGYISGGNYGFMGNTLYSTVEKLQFLNESIGSLTSTLDTAKYRSASVFQNS